MARASAFWMVSARTKQPKMYAKSFRISARLAWVSLTSVMTLAPSVSNLYLCWCPSLKLSVVASTKVAKPWGTMTGSSPTIRPRTVFRHSEWSYRTCTKSAMSLMLVMIKPLLRVRILLPSVECVTMDAVAG